MKIQLTDKYRILHDGFQWTSEEYHEEHTSRKDPDKVIEAQWVSHNKYWPHPAQAVRYITGLCISDDGGVVSIKYFELFLIKFHKETMKEINNAL